MYTYEYPRPALTADAVVFSYHKDRLYVLMIQRGQEPFKNQWAFPGGFMEMDETPHDCAIRELEEETGLKLDELREVGAFAKVNRDPRGRVISIAYFYILNEDIPKLKAASDAKTLQWIPIDQLPQMAFDHQDMLKNCCHTLKQHMKLAIYDNMPYLGFDRMGAERIIDLVDDSHLDFNS